MALKISEPQIGGTGPRSAGRLNKAFRRRFLTSAPARMVAWATMSFYAAGMGSKIWLAHRLGVPQSLESVMLVLGFGAIALVGSLLVAKRPANPLSWIMIAIGLIVGLFPAAEAYAAYVMTTRGVPDPLAVFGVWANGIYWVPLLVLSLVYLPLLFPDGRLPSRRWLPVAVLPGLTAAGYAMLSAFQITLNGQELAYQIDNPIGIEGIASVSERLLPVLTVGIFIGILGAVASVFVRFRRSRGVERQQLKWFLFAVALAPILIVPVPIPIVEDLLLGLILIGLPVAICVAVLRYRLYDIDLIIRKALIYTSLTILLALVYFGGVVVLQEILAPLTGQGNSPLVLVITTLGVAALFSPLRRRVQEAIDRRFFRRKYQAEHVLADFARAARDESDLEALTSELERVVRETIQPEQVRLWLKEARR